LCVIYKPREWGSPSPLGAVTAYKNMVNHEAEDNFVKITCMSGSL
jgi:hypothetical protein